LRVVGPDLGHRDLAALGGVADVALAEALVDEEAQGAVGEAGPVTGVEDRDGDLAGADAVAGGHGGGAALAGVRLAGQRLGHGRPAPEPGDDEHGAEHGEGDDRLEMDAHAVPPVAPLPGL
jgi:hypothetical protein